ncbi:MAG: hypothetical protein EZS28_013121 [Streblomastix strix]|uniref:Uncharacterized protein n=1 Tax=Streblomastix strix TaxID=222440 RepID=A0A5J4W9M5_9EUKA|nr:MAG: hypothetical protein EZS28_013121 [Streblomastix strix]
MEKSTFRPDLTAQSVAMTGSDVSTIFPHLILDLESDNKNLHAPALRQLLEIILDNRESKDLVLKYKLMPLLNKFAGNVEKNEEFVLSTTISHVIGVRNGSDDKMILAGAATESIIQTIFSPDEKTSKSGSKALSDLIEENEIICHSLMTTGFISKVQHTFTNNQQSSSSSSQTESITPNHVKCGLLDVLIRLVETVDDLQPFAILIPILIELKKNQDKNIKKKSENILGLLNSKGINAPSSDSKEKDEKIQQLEELNRKKDEEINKLKQENQKENTEKEKLKQENVKLLEEVEKYKPKPAQVIINQDFPIQIINHDPSSFGFADVNGVQKKITNLKQNRNSVSLTQDMSDGIWSMEATFTNLQNQGAIGIVRATRNLVTGNCPCCYEGCNDIVIYGGCCGHKEYCSCKGIRHSGNTKYGDNQLVRAELDFGKQTLTFFLDNIQQPVYITGIREKVRFMVYMQMQGASCTIKSLRKLQQPTVGQVANMKAVQW